MLVLGIENNILGSNYPFDYAIMHIIVGYHLHESALLILLPLDDLLAFDCHPEQHCFLSALAEQDQ